MVEGKVFAAAAPVFRHRLVMMFVVLITKVTLRFAMVMLMWMLPWYTNTFCYSLVMMFVVIMRRVTVMMMLSMLIIMMIMMMLMFFDNNDDIIMIMLMTTLRMS